MTDIYVQKHFGMLAPSDEDAEEIIAQMKQGQVIKMRYSFPRNYKYHQKFFAFIKVTFDMQEFFDNIHHYRKWLIMKSGHYTTITAPNGYTIFDADSIRFDKMDEPSFRKLFSDCIDVLLTTLFKDSDRDELMRIIDFS